MSQMSQCQIPFTLSCPICDTPDTLLEMAFSGQKIIILAGYCPTCHSMWHSVYQRKTGEVTHYPVTFYVWCPCEDGDTEEVTQEDTSC